MFRTGVNVRHLIGVLKMGLVFAGVFLALQNSYQASRSTPIETLLIDHATVAPSAFLINWLDPAQHVVARNNKLVSPQVNLSILNGCEGVEAMFLLIAAIAAFSATWLKKVTGIVIGIVLLYGVNQIRIVSLYFAAEQNRELFSLLHGYLAPTFIILLACVFFMGWMQWSIAPPYPPKV